MEENKIIEGVKISRQAMRINHLFYVDDLIVFFNANTKPYGKLHDILKGFGVASGLLINLNKFELLFSQNTPRLIEKFLSSIFKVKVVSKMGKYL